MTHWWDQRPEALGYDPYNTAAAADTASREMVAEMEHVWRKCLVATTPAPAFIIPSIGFWDSYYELLATPDRGHEFEPYARA